MNGSDSVIPENKDADSVGDPLPEPRKELIERARDAYESDDIQIDDDAKILTVDQGVWVSAWVFVTPDDREQTL